MPRAETRVPCLFKQLSFTRGEHVAWTRVARELPRRPSPARLQPPSSALDKQEVSPHPRERTRPAKVHVEGTSARSWGRCRTSACFRASRAAKCHGSRSVYEGPIILVVTSIILMGATGAESNTALRSYDAFCGSIIAALCSHERPTRPKILGDLGGRRRGRARGRRGGCGGG